MVLYIMYRNQPVCSATTNELCLSGLIVKDYTIFESGKLPFYYNDKQSVEETGLMIRLWFESRVKPNTDPDLDTIMCSVYHLKYYRFDHMYNFQYLGALMSYMSSEWDDYWVNPAAPCYLTYNLSDPLFDQVYLWEPSDFKTAKTAGGEFRKCLRKHVI